MNFLKYFVRKKNCEQENVENVKGELVGNDKGYRYKLISAGDNEFVNPDDEASLVFDAKDKNAITLVLFGKFKFRKVI